MTMTTIIALQVSRHLLLPREEEEAVVVQAMIREVTLHHRTRSAVETILNHLIVTTIRAAAVAVDMAEAAVAVAAAVDIIAAAQEARVEKDLTEIEDTEVLLLAVLHHTRIEENNCYNKIKRKPLQLAKIHNANSIVILMKGKIEGIQITFTNKLFFIHHHCHQHRHHYCY